MTTNYTKKIKAFSEKCKDTKMKIYFVEHIYEKYDLDEAKPLGTFSSVQNAKKCIDFYKDLEGFRKYQKCFKIHTITLDTLHWQNGFIKGFDIPHFVFNDSMLPNETPLQYAKRLCDKHYGSGKYPTYFGSEFREIKRYASCLFQATKATNTNPPPIFKTPKKLPKYVYYLENSYEVDIYFMDMFKLLGVFSSKANANLALKYAKSLCGFKSEVANRFSIVRDEIDNFDTSTWGFGTGFVEMR